MSSAKAIPAQLATPWAKVINVAMKSLKKRLVRSMMTMASVILSIAFLSYTWLSHDIVSGLKVLDNIEINTLMMRQGIDLSVAGMPAKTKWLIMLSLMVSSIGILNAMLMSVTERFKEIGTMKCIGATNGFIVKLFMVEASIQGAIGTSLGIVIGIIGAFIINAFNYGGAAFSAFPFVAGCSSIVLSLLIGMAMTLLFAAYPAYVAANMLPVEAMRVEE